MEIFYLILGLLLLGGGVGYNVYSLHRFVKNKEHNAFTKKEFLLLLAGQFAISLSGSFLLPAIAGLSKWEINNGSMTMGVFAVFFFLLSFSAIWECLYLYYWRKDADEKQRKITRFTMFAAIPLAVITFFLLGEAVAEYLSYPLVSGFAIDGTGFHWTTYQDGRSGFSINWYGVVIVFGAVVSYWITDHRFYKKFGRHGIMDSCLLLVLPAGIIGARIWYVIGNWNGDGAGGPNFSQYCANGQWYKMFEIWNGGITILGGAAAGIIAGALFVIFRRKYVDVRWAADVVVPAILIAQAIGRWGNFFNHEVYGQMVNMSDWTILPTWIRYQMATSFSGGKPFGDQMYVPLFLIEAIANVIGYFVIAWGIGKIWKPKTEANNPKWYHRSLGDLAAFYLVWYGITRVIMEPLRDPSYNMGASGNWSVINAIIYIALGVAFLIFFHVVDYFLIKKGKPLDRSDLSFVPRKAPEPAPSAIPTKKQKPVDLDAAPKKIVVKDEKKEE